MSTPSTTLNQTESARVRELTLAQAIREALAEECAAMRLST